MRRTVEELEIRYLVHFSAAENLHSILNHGIIPRKVLNQNNFQYKWNDDVRYDGCLGASCFSIDFPNYKMFYPTRLNGQHKDWVVLGIDKKVLWEKDCAFCVENAAKNTMTALTIEERKGTYALKKLFEDFPGKPNRKKLNLAKFVPTNPQSEVLIFDIVEVENIFEVAFENEEVMKKYQHLIPENIRVSINKQMFYGRFDHEYWK